MAATTPCQKAGRRLRLTKPGPATSILSMSASALELVGELVGDVARLHLRRLGEHERGVAGEVAVRGIARGQHLDIGEVEPLGKRAIGLQRPQRGKDAGMHERVDVHRGCLPERGEMVRS